MKGRTERVAEPLDKALVPFVCVEDMMSLINAPGLDRCLVELTDTIAKDVARWERFDKTPRVASHSAIAFASVAQKRPFDRTMATAALSRISVVSASCSE